VGNARAARAGADNRGRCGAGQRCSVAATARSRFGPRAARRRSPGPAVHLVLSVEILTLAVLPGAPGLDEQRLPPVSYLGNTRVHAAHSPLNGTTRSSCFQVITPCVPGPRHPNPCRSPSIACRWRIGWFAPLWVRSPGPPIAQKSAGTRQRKKLVSAPEGTVGLGDVPGRLAGCAPCSRCPRMTRAHRARKGARLVRDHGGARAPWCRFPLPFGPQRVLVSPTDRAASAAASAFRKGAFARGR